MIVHIDFEGKTMIFKKPIKILITHDYKAIKDHMDEIESLVQQGYYAVGYLSYESAMGFNTFNLTKSVSNDSLPLLLFGIFDTFSLSQEPAIKAAATTDFSALSLELASNINRREYNQKIAYIKSQIAAGNTYQTNFTLQFTAPFNADPLEYYHFLQKNNQADYCSYLQFESYHILSISPELFFKLDQRIVTTKPMKGTAARGINLVQDKEKLQELLSEKNQAENMMIVDLLRNDLNRISESGTVEVTKLFDAEKYPTVWQLTSTITAKLKQNISLYQIFQGLFPCGSITGAPKTSTMDIIAKIEKSERGVYCGSIGYIAPFLTQAAFNIPIRTLTIKRNQLSYGVGGGVTWDSTDVGEYDEILEKTAILRHTNKMPDYLIESLLLEDGVFFLLDEHLNRLHDSANYFDFNCNITLIHEQLMKLAAMNEKGCYKVRLLQFVNATHQIECEPIYSPMLLNAIELTSNPVNSKNVYLYHKTSNRQHLPTLTTGKESIIFNEKNEVTEFINGNLVLLLNNQWITPKITSGLLTGIMRDFYLKTNKITEAVVPIRDLLRAEKIVFINSVRKWVVIDDAVLISLQQNILKRL